MHNSNFVSKILKGWKIILFFLVVASLLAVKYNYFTAKKFRTTAQVKTNEFIEKNQTGLLSKTLTSLGINFNFADASSSNAVADAVSKQNLHVEYYQVETLFKSELYNYSPITVSFFLKNESFYKQDFIFKYSGANNFLLSYEYNGITRDRAGEFGKEIHEAELNFTVNKNLELIPARAEELLSNKLQFIIYSDKALADNLLKNAINTSFENGLTVVSVTNNIPEKATLLANAVAESLLEENSSSANLSLINEQLSTVTEELDNAQVAITKYKIENHITDIPIQIDAQLKHLENLEVQKMNLDLQSLALDNLSDYLRQNRINGNAAPEYGTITDPVFAEYITKLNEKIGEQLSNSSNANLEAEISFLKNTIAEGIRNTRKKVALQKNEINSQIASTKASFSVLPERESDLQTLNRNLYLVEKRYNYLADKRTEAIYAKALPYAQNKLIQKADLPQEPINTEASTVWMLAILFGLITGRLAAFILSKFKKPAITDRNAIDIQQSIPYFASIENGSKKDISVQFSNICTKLLVKRQETRKQIITVTSTTAGEGKTFISTQLGKSLAALDLKVLLLDMNSENPSLDCIFELSTNQTLAEVIQKQNQFQEAVQLTSIPDLDVMIGGNFPNGINSLIAANKISQVLDELQKHYDYIIIDTTNTINSIEAIPLMKISDINLYVVNSGADANSVFENAEHIRSDYNLDNLFFILNKITGTINHTGSQISKKSFSRVILKDSEHQNSERIPFLRKVALWFY